MGDLDGITWVIDPVAVCLLGIFVLGVVVLLSTDHLDIRIVQGKPNQPPVDDDVASCDTRADVDLTHFDRR